MRIIPVSNSLFVGRRRAKWGDIACLISTEAQENKERRKLDWFIVMIVMSHCCVASCGASSDDDVFIPKSSVKTRQKVGFREARMYTVHMSGSVLKPGATRLIWKAWRLPGPRSTAYFASVRLWPSQYARAIVHRWRRAATTSREGDHVGRHMVRRVVTDSVRPSRRAMQGKLRGNSRG